MFEEEIKSNTFTGDAGKLADDAPRIIAYARQCITRCITHEGHDPERCLQKFHKELSIAPIASNHYHGQDPIRPHDKRTLTDTEKVGVFILTVIGFARLCAWAHFFHSNHYTIDDLVPKLVELDHPATPETADVRADFYKKVLRQCKNYDLVGMLAKEVRHILPQAEDALKIFYALCEMIDFEDNWWLKPIRRVTRQERMQAGLEPSPPQ